MRHLNSFRLSALTVIIALFSVFGGSLQTALAQDWGRLLQGGLELFQSMTISDDEIKSYVSQFVTQSDQKNQVAAANSSYTTRLNNITRGITSVDGQPLNFKVYMTNDINAFACADGSVRVYSGLMDAMTDDEVLGVIGHEIGHVAHKDTKKAMQNALRTAAFRDALASTSGTIAVLTDSQLGVLGEAIINAKYSQKQESNADEYGYEFLKKHGRNPLALCLAFKKLQQLEQNSGTSGLVANLFSDHPDTAKRIKDLEKKAIAEGYSYPTSSSGGSAAKSSGSVTNTVKSSSGTSGRGLNGHVGGSSKSKKTTKKK